MIPGAPARRAAGATVTPVDIAVALIAAVAVVAAAVDDGSRYTGS